MPQENVEVVRQADEALNRGCIEGALAIIDPPPDFEFVPSGTPLVAGVGDVHGGIAATSETFGCSLIREQRWDW
jgi:hypothetical protein